MPSPRTTNGEILRSRRSREGWPRFVSSEPPSRGTGPGPLRPSPVVPSGRRRDRSEGRRLDGLGADCPHEPEARDDEDEPEAGEEAGEAETHLQGRGGDAADT